MSVCLSDCNIIRKQKKASKIFSKKGKVSIRHLIMTIFVGIHLKVFSLQSGYFGMNPSGAVEKPFWQG